MSCYYHYNITPGQRREGTDISQLQLLRSLDTNSEATTLSRG